MSPFKLGKLDAVRPHGLSELAVYARGKLPEPPPGVPPMGAGVADWGVLGNDTYGDCTMAGAAHMVMAFNAEVSESDPMPDSAQVVEQYLALSGGQDSGLAEADVLRTWATTGLFGDAPIAGYAPVAVGDLTAIHQAIAFYGGGYQGVALPG